MKRKNLIMIALCSFSFMAWMAQAMNPETAPMYKTENIMPNGY